MSWDTRFPFAWQRLGQILFAPSPEVRDPVWRRRVSLMSKLTLAHAMALTANIFNVLSRPELGNRGALARVFGVAVVALVLVYAVTRSRRVWWAIGAGIAVEMAIPPSVFLLANDSTLSPFQSIAFLLPSVLIAASMISARAGLAVGAANVLLTFALGSLGPESWAMSIAMGRGYLIILTLLLTIFARHRDGIEADHLTVIRARNLELEALHQNLECRVQERTRELSERTEKMALVLDNVDQGLAMIDRDGKFLGESSRAFRESFGLPIPGTPFYENLGDKDDTARFALALGYDQLISEILPVELALDQMPKSIVRDERHYSLAFTPVRHGDRFTGALLVTRDVTRELLARRTEAVQRERVRIFEHIMRNRVGFHEFLQEARRLMTSVRHDDGAGPEERIRALHTLKGITAVFDVNSVSEAAHDLEQTLTEDVPEDIGHARERLFASWESFMTLVAPIAGDEVARRVELSHEDFSDLIDGVRAQAPYPVLLNSLIRLTYEPIQQRFLRMEDQLKSVARRLNKPEPLVVIQAGDLRLPAARFQPFWSSLTHVIRNIVDHGFELEEVRLTQGKSARNRVELRAVAIEQGLMIEMADDGRGIDWERLAQKAREKGLPSETRAHLALAVFADGVSTADRVSQTSGRGVGMSAVKESCEALGGSVTVKSERGRGTCFRFMFPPLDDTALETSKLLSAPSRATDSLGPSPANV